jgi:hypothetical protein
MIILVRRLDDGRKKVKDFGLQTRRKEGRKIII